MKPELSADGWKVTTITDHETRRFHERAIPYGSYTEATTVRFLIIMGLTVLAGLALLAGLSILRG